ncbi:MAG: DUF4388 domain-containing protein [Chloroflexi bacterium]|nr:DUF4388 domain-containing protein [Chloroflexota bacterium]
MALKGNLRDFTITQLLNLVNLAKKTGTLEIQGSGGAAKVMFREGKLAYAQFSNEDASLASILHRNKKITRGQRQLIANRASQISDKELGLLLINAGYVSQDDILTSLQTYFISVVQRLFTWVEGVFQFEQNLQLPEDKIAVRIDLENLIIEGARQMREWELLQDEIPSLDMALKFTDRPETNLKNVNLSVEEWRVVSYVNPKNSIQQIARAANLSDMEIRKVVYGLLQAGLIEIVRPGGGPTRITKQMFPTTNRDEQKNLLSRLVDRIRSL